MDNKVSINDLVQLCAVDDNLLCTTFFPKAARQSPAPFHADIWRHLNDPAKRYINLVCFRDSAKTTILRMFTGKRVAFNVSKTILYVSASEAHAANRAADSTALFPENGGGVSAGRLPSREQS